MSTLFCLFLNFIFFIKKEKPWLLFLWVILIFLTRRSASADICDEPDDREKKKNCSKNCKSGNITYNSFGYICTDNKADNKRKESRNNYSDYSKAAYFSSAGAFVTVAHHFYIFLYYNLSERTYPLRYILCYGL